MEDTKIEIAHSGLVTAEKLSCSGNFKVLKGAQVKHGLEGTGPIRHIELRGKTTPLITIKFPYKENYQTTLDRLFAGNFQVFLALKACSTIGLTAPWKAFLTERLYHLGLALDIEASVDSIWEIGIFFEGQQDTLLTPRADPDVGLRRALRRLKELSNDRLLIGHNLIAWDIRRLREHHRRYYPNLSTEALLDRPAWDTQLIGFLLEPWRNSFALTTSAQAHVAAHDAEAAFQLCVQQFERLGEPELLKVLSNANMTSGELYDSLGKALATVGGRSYPTLSSDLIQCINTQRGALLVVPESRLCEFDWIPAVRFALLQGKHRIRRLIDPTKLHGEHNPNLSDIHNKILYWLLLDTHCHDIQLRVDALPLWLTERTKELIETCTDLTEASLATAGKGITVTTYRSLAGYAQRITDWARQHGANLMYPCEGMLELAQPLCTLDHETLRQRLPEAPPESPARSLYRRLSDSEVSQLLPSRPASKLIHWLQWDPARRSSTGEWVLWEGLNCAGFNIEPTESKLTTLFTSPYNRSVPHAWLTGLWPSTAVRSDYWEDTLTRFICLLESDPRGPFLLLVVDV